MLRKELIDEYRKENGFKILIESDYPSYIKYGKETKMFRYLIVIWLYNEMILVSCTSKIKIKDNEFVNTKAIKKKPSYEEIELCFTFPFKAKSFLI